MQTENLKLQTDIKIIRNEHSEILHQLHVVRSKNENLLTENQTLKNMLRGEQETKGRETNLPLPLDESKFLVADDKPHQSAQKPLKNDATHAHFHLDSGRQKPAIARQSPFAKAMNVRQDFSHDRRSVSPDEVGGPNTIQQSDFAGTGYIEPGSLHIHHTAGESLNRDLN